MPIYAYKCESCGFAKDVLQKMSDPLLTDCPSCSASTFRKQVTAAGFQLKGSGWYATDFKGGSAAASATAPASTPSDSGSKVAESTKPAESAAPKADSSPAPASGGCSGSCACH
ncbi:MAG: FmdB family zinc ribbon protein [Pseudomonadota bacterium]